MCEGSAHTDDTQLISPVGNRISVIDLSKSQTLLPFESPNNVSRIARSEYRDSDSAGGGEEAVADEEAEEGGVGAVVVAEAGEGSGPVEEGEGEAEIQRQVVKENV
ncbi:hypothetical protein QJS10_CPA05g00321 [Acorus calamus]|uniref:Uncharacterized protein n=1 Tax=Acorus calamus TaxID=4465 RepID=A0AAV9ERQ8_ACOCL|nr:hypothetical protein QJS10_CPA05g00321 [Acorus calamus]